MAYHLDAEKISLDDLQKRLEATDLVPSRASLLDGLGTKMKALEKQGIVTLGRLVSKAVPIERLRLAAQKRDRQARTQ